MNGISQSNSRWKANSAAADWLRENLGDMDLTPPEILGGETVLSF